MLPSRPTKVRASRFDQSVGGMAANAACTVAALGGQVSFCGPVGDDEIGDRILAALRQAGVATHAALIVPGARSSHSAIVVQADGERLIISHHGDALEADAGALAQRALDADAVLIDVRWPAGAMALADRARSGGLPIVLDGEMGNPALLAALVPRADHVIFSESGFAEWLQVRCGRPLGGEEPAGVGAQLAGIVAAGATLAAVTFGERGVVWALRGDTAGASGSTSGAAATIGRLPAFAVEVVETLGAGDAFHGAYALALAERSAPLDALRFAAAAAALRCTRRGGNRDLPTRAEVLALLRDQPSAGCS